MKRVAFLSAVTTVVELTSLVACCGVTSEETRAVIGRNITSVGVIQYDCTGQDRVSSRDMHTLYLCSQFH
jgi:hypothetical protein